MSTLSIADDTFTVSLDYAAAEASAENYVKAKADYARLTEEREAAEEAEVMLESQLHAGKESITTTALMKATFETQRLTLLHQGAELRSNSATCLNTDLTVAEVVADAVASKMPWAKIVLSNNPYHRTEDGIATVVVAQTVPANRDSDGSVSAKYGSNSVTLAYTRPASHGAMDWEEIHQALTSADVDVTADWDERVMTASAGDSRTDRLSFDVRSAYPRLMVVDPDKIADFASRLTLQGWANKVSYSVTYGSPVRVALVTRATIAGTPQVDADGLRLTEVDLKLTARSNDLNDAALIDVLRGTANLEGEVLPGVGRVQTASIEGVQFDRSSSGYALKAKLVALSA